MDSSDVEKQVSTLLREQTTLRIQIRPIGWRRQDHQGRWHLIDTNGLVDWQLRGFGCEPVFAERKPMSDDVAAKLSNQVKGTALVRAVETWHGIAGEPSASKVFSR